MSFRDGVNDEVLQGRIERQGEKDNGKTTKKEEPSHTEGRAGVSGNEGGAPPAPRDGLNSTVAHILKDGKRLPLPITDNRIYCLLPPVLPIIVFNSAAITRFPALV